MHLVKDILQGLIALCRKLSSELALLDEVGYAVDGCVIFV